MMLTLVVIERVSTYVGIPPYSELKLREGELGTIDVITSRICINVVVSLSSLVKISAMLKSPAICLMTTVPSRTDSRTAFSRIVI